MLLRERVVETEQQRAGRVYSSAYVDVCVCVYCTFVCVCLCVCHELSMHGSLVPVASLIRERLGLDIYAHMHGHCLVQVQGLIHVHLCT